MTTMSLLYICSCAFICLRFQIMMEYYDEIIMKL